MHYLAMDFINQVCDDRISKEYIGYATSGEGRTFVSVKFKSGAANAEIEINDPQQWLLELEKENTVRIQWLLCGYVI